MKYTEELQLPLYDLVGEDRGISVYDSLEAEYGFSPSSSMQKIDIFAKSTTQSIKKLGESLPIPKLTAIFTSTVNNVDWYKITDSNVTQFVKDSVYLITFSQSSSNTSVVTLNNSVTGIDLLISENGSFVKIGKDDVYANTFYQFVYNGTALVLVENKKQNYKDVNLKTNSKTIVGAINENNDMIKSNVGRNFLINSNFSVCQRTTSALVPSVANYIVPDRYKFGITSGSPTISQLNSTTGGIKCTGGSATMYYIMDAYDFAIVSGKACTLSYKVNGQIKTQQLTPSSATVVSLTLANGDQLEWVKLELGTQATEYIPPRYVDNLNECQRYYFEFYFSFMATANRYDIGNFYFSNMRVIPTMVVLPNTKHTTGKVSLWSGDSVEVTPYRVETKINYCMISMPPLVNVSIDAGYSGYIKLDAEL